MKHKNLNKTKWLVPLMVTCFIVLFFGEAQLFSQTAIMKANRTWCGVIENMGSGSFNYGGGWFPADYNAMGPSMEEGSGLTGSRVTTACLNWTDPEATFHTKGVTRTGDGYVVTVNSALTNYTRWGMPTNVVDFDDVTVNDWGEVNPSGLIGTSAQTAGSVVTNAMGVEIQREIFAWSQQFHDTYIAVDLELTNNSGSTLEGFYVTVQMGPFYMRKAKGSDPGVPDEDEVGVDRSACWHHYYGARPGDSLRIHYMYHADNPDVVGDQMGGPVATQDGRLMESDIMYYAILHASEVPYTDPANDVDDPLQPRVTDVYAPPAMQTEALWGSKDADARAFIYDLIAGRNGQLQPMDGQYAGTFHRANNDEQNDPDWSNLGEGLNKAAVWNRSISSFGPYTFENGQSIHIVYVSGYTGIGIKKEKEIGEMWKAGTLQDPPNLPDPEAGYFPTSFAFSVDATPMDKIKDRWIGTGIDSVHKAVSRAKWNFENGWQALGTPEPPQTEITGTGEGVEIKWSTSTVEIDPNFDGYRILKRIGQRDTTFFEVVYETGSDDIASEHSYVDENVLFGASYYYFVQSSLRIPINDPNAHPDTRGKKIYSGRVWTPAHVQVNPKRPSNDDMSQIRIVPNPYNIKDDLLENYQFNVERQGIQFYNLPPVVTIKIFTESGDLFREIEHAPLTGDGLYIWDMLSNNQQVAASGVYIAVFEIPGGELSYQKFIVVR